MEVGGDCSVTAVDVGEHPVVGALAAGRGELTGLALWLMAEREQVGGRNGAPMLQDLGLRPKPYGAPGADVPRLAGGGGRPGFRRLS